MDILNILIIILIIAIIFTGYKKEQFLNKCQEKCLVLSEDNHQFSDNDMKNLELDIHIMKNLDINVGERKLENDLSEKDLEKMMVIVNKIWNRYGVKWNFKFHYDEDMTENLKKYYLDLNDFSTKVKSINYLLSRNFSENKLLYRHEFYKLINLEYFTKDLYKVYIFPYLGVESNGLVIKNNEYDIYLSRYNPKNLKPYNLNELAREMAKYLGYYLGLETSNKLGNLMSKSGFNLDEDQKSILLYAASNYKKDIREVENSRILINKPITMSPLFEYKVDCKVYDEVLGDKCIHHVIKKTAPKGLYLPDKFIKDELSFLDFLNSKNPCDSVKSYMDKLGYSYL